MKAKKMKSGKWRARYVERYEYTPDGKRKVVLGCVTRDTEREAIRAAMDLELKNATNTDLTVKTAIDRYIELKQPVLSPSTIRSYLSVAKNAYNEIGSLKLADLTTELLQLWVSRYSLDHSPKATANAHGLLIAAVGMFRPEARFKVSLPKRNPPQLYTPTEADVTKLLESARINPKLYRAVILGTYGLRRGEICALTYADLSERNCTVSVTKDLVRNPSGEWISKAPKTPQSIRTVQIAPEAVQLLMKDFTDPHDHIVDMHPEAITNAFKRALKRAGLPDFRFHDLRSFSASLQHALGVPDQYIMRAHGWKTDTVLKQVYRRTMADREQEYNSMVQSRMSGLLKNA